MRVENVEGAVGRYDAGDAKHASRFYELAISGLGVRAECLYVGGSSDTEPICSARPH